MTPAQLQALLLAAATATGLPVVRDLVVGLLALLVVGCIAFYVSVVEP